MRLPQSRSYSLASLAPWFTVDPRLRPLRMVAHAVARHKHPSFSAAGIPTFSVSSLQVFTEAERYEYSLTRARAAYDARRLETENVKAELEAGVRAARSKARAASKNDRLTSIEDQIRR